MGQFDKNDVRVTVDEKQTFGLFTLLRYQVHHRLFSGAWSEALVRVCCNRLPAVVVIPYDPWQDQVIMVEQFRIGSWVNDEDPWLFELVAGIIEKGATPLQTAQKELQEETGLIAKSVEKITDYLVSPGASNERVYLYYACVDASHSASFAGCLDEHEDIRVHRFSFEKVAERLAAGHINNSASLIGLQWLAIHRARLREAI